MTKVTSENVLVDSSLVNSMHYMPKTKNLYVTFSNGTIYKKIFNVFEYRKI
jgi:hypothetical protein